jgi:hypothetical protein
VSCRDGRILHEWKADAEEFFFAWYSLGGGPVACGVGDWDGDGCADVAVGSPHYGDCRGRVDVYSGTSGATLRRFLGDEPQAGLGMSLGPLEDLDGDGEGELAIAAVTGFDNACQLPPRELPGSVQIRLSRNGEVLATLQPATPSPVFGLSLASSGDLDGDGRADLWVGEPLANFYACPLVTPGLQAWTSQGWRALLRIESSHTNDGYTDRRFGAVLVAIDDVDGDRVRDLVATVPDSFGGDACVISGRGQILRRFSFGPDFLDVSNLGMSACVVGDLDRDGAREVVLSGAQWRGCLVGVASVVSPKKGTTLRSFTRASILTAPDAKSGK